MIIYNTIVKKYSLKIRNADFKSFQKKKKMNIQQVR